MSTELPRFCPVCRESFGMYATRCPQHDEMLVAWERLPSQAPQGEPDRDEAEANSASTPPRRLLLRANLGLGAILLLVGFPLPLVRLHEPKPQALSALELAMTHPSLWVVPLTAFALVALLLRNSSDVALFRARLALFVLALMPAVSVLATLHGALLAAHPTRADTAVLLRSVGSGALVMVAGATVAAAGSLALYWLFRPAQARQSPKLHVVVGDR